jgi:hypothetical protein
MSLSNISKTVAAKVTAAAFFCLAVSATSAATPNTAPNVNFTASGTFGNPPVSGSDTLKLAGEPFAINIVVNAAMAPIQHGPNWAIFSPLKMTGQVHSGLLGTTPISIASGAASIEQGYGPTYDPFQTAFPVKIVGVNLTVLAVIKLPAGTIPNQLIHPFAAVALSPATATVTYSDGTNSTMLSVQTGTLVATVQTSGAAPSAAVRPTAAQISDLDASALYGGSEAVLVQRRRAVRWRTSML